MASSNARVTVFAMAAAVTGVVPLPIIPRRILRTIRGAMAYDLCSQHGLALTAEARDILSEPHAGGMPVGMTKDAIAFFAGRALSRLGGPYTMLLSPVRAAYETLAFGRLLDRYLEKYRSGSSRGRIVRIDGEEALTIRQLLDRAAMRVIRPGLDSTTALAAEPPEDYRGTIDKALDTAMITAARMPEWVASRLDAALDDVLRDRGST
jgi:uncharacterized protein (DUF697 family)